MKLLAAIDSFKGSATSKELNQAVLEGWGEAEQKINQPIADGGEGTAEAIYATLGGEWRTLSCPDLLFRKKECRYLLTQKENRKLAIIESTEVIGLDLLTRPTDQTIRLASSFGLGELIKDALNQFVDEIIVTLGGSGCSDGGLGLLQSLGAKLNGVTEGNPLLTIKELDLSQLMKIDQTVTIAADVTNPYTGEQGATQMFGKQKGGSPETLACLEEQAEKIVEQIKTKTAIDLNQLAGSGAAGGIGGALAIVGAEMKSGFTLVSELVDLEAKIKESELIVTGEGRIDQQTIHGKVPYGVALLAKKHGKKIVAICGSREKELGELASVLPSVFSIQTGPISLEKALDHQETLESARLLSQAISGIFR
ncbi:glycerate kinase [Candidatus Enterococcus mangumiae]|uniref:Glycerate 2-kinase n=1 Tax=Candidatus Enterococcus mangumiae TaxID=2230878 RepID=A0ABZ2SUQ7_9ENTE|nr:glycerate kinase [Enterococcus sp. DIV1094]MBO0488984.1 glycerate kinase [Enterococcus sp. DIV1094]